MKITLTPELKAAHQERLEFAASKIELALEDRDEAILEAKRDGLSDAEIAGLVGLTRQRVWQIVRAS